MASRYAYRYAEILGNFGLTIVSGLARELIQAHLGSLSTGTIAVMEIVLTHPIEENAKLYEDIISVGCVISECHQNETNAIIPKGSYYCWIVVGNISCGS